jgi:hypothetical protein
MNTIVKNFTSRKFLLALSAFIFCVANANVPGAVAVVLGYLGVQGGIDHKNIGK